MFTPDDLLKLKRSEPFIPLNLHLKDGQVVEIPYASAFLVGRFSLVVGVYTGNRRRYFDSHILVYYEQIAHVEVIEADQLHVVDG